MAYDSYTVFMYKGRDRKQRIFFISHVLGFALKRKEGVQSNGTADACLIYSQLKCDPTILYGHPEPAGSYFWV